MNFASLVELAAFTAEFIGEVDHLEHKSLEMVGKLVEEAAKEAIGTYDYGWPELSDRTQEERERLGFSPNDPLLRTGELQESIKHDVDNKTVYIGSTLDKALFHEIGTSKIPPRPFLVPSAERNKEKIENMIGRGFLKGLSGDVGTLFSESET